VTRLARVGLRRRHRVSRTLTRLIVYPQQVGHPLRMHAAESTVSELPHLLHFTNPRRSDGSLSARVL
jgi:hypothetical protein